MWWCENFGVVSDVGSVVGIIASGGILDATAIVNIGVSTMGDVVVALLLMVLGLLL